MHWEILDNKRENLLKQISDNIDIGDYYMAGGTALSLLLGLRKSVDFDFFVPHKFNTDMLYVQLKDIAGEDISSVNVDGKGTCDVVMCGVQVSFFEYPYKTLQSYVYDKSIPKLAMANVRDIAAMKALAIGGRGAKKDFFDLYEIFIKNDYSVKQLVHDLYDKYGHDRDLSYIGMGLNYFEEADLEQLPETFVEYDWEKIKKYYQEMQKSFFDEIYRIEHDRTK